MAWVEVTTVYGEIHLNTDHVVFARLSAGGGTTLLLANGRELSINESYQAWKRKFPARAPH